MKKLVLVNGKYEVQETKGLNAAASVFYAPIGGLMGDAQIGGVSRSNTLISLAVGATLGATVMYPIMKKSIDKAKNLSTAFKRERPAVEDNDSVAV